MVREYIAFYGKKTKKNPKDTNALYAMGLLYLSLKNYELAQRNFKDAIDQSPLDADVYYYYALSLVAGKSIRAMNGREVARAEEYLKTALGMEVKCKYLALLAAIQTEYYQANNLVFPDKKVPGDYFAEAADYSPDDLEEITDNLTFRHEATRQSINRLMGKEEEDEAEYEKATNLTEEQRKSYYDYRFKPEKGAYRNVPVGVGFGIYRAVTFVGCFFLFCIMLAFDTCVGCSIKVHETIHSVDNAVRDHTKTMAKKYDSTFSPEELEQKHVEYRADSIKKAASYEKFVADNQNLSKLFTWVVNKDGTTHHFYRKTSLWAWIGVFIVFSPLIWWVLITLAGIVIPSATAIQPLDTTGKLMKIMYMRWNVTKTSPRMHKCSSTCAISFP